MSEIHLPTPYEQIGGEKAVRHLVDRFYQLMDEKSHVRQLRTMHPEDLATSRDKLFKFLSGWLGGPDLFVQEFGHPMLRARHMPFSIDQSARDQWLHCMFEAINEMDMSDSLKQQLEVSFFRTADFMRNKEG